MFTTYSWLGLVVSLGVNMWLFLSASLEPRPPPKPLPISPAPGHQYRVCHHHRLYSPQLSPPPTPRQALPPSEPSILGLLRSILSRCLPSQRTASPAPRHLPQHGLPLRCDLSLALCFAVLPTKPGSKIVARTVRSTTTRQFTRRRACFNLKKRFGSLF